LFKIDKSKQKLTLANPVPVIIMQDTLGLSDAFWKFLKICEVFYHATKSLVFKKILRTFRTLVEVSNL